MNNPVEWDGMSGSDLPPFQISIFGSWSFWRQRITLLIWRLRGYDYSRLLSGGQFAPRNRSPRGALSDKTLNNPGQRGGEL